MILLLLATSPELLPMHLAALDRNLLEDPLILSAVKACADFLSVSAWNGFGKDFGYKYIATSVEVTRNGGDCTGIPPNMDTYDVACYSLHGIFW